MTIRLKYLKSKVLGKMDTNLETKVGSFEQKVGTDIKNSQKARLLDGKFYEGFVEVSPLERRQEVLDYLRRHQDTYGMLHPMEIDEKLAERVDRSKMPTILIDPTEEQAINLARGVDRACSGPLKYIKNISVLTIRGCLTQSFY